MTIAICDDERIQLDTLECAIRRCAVHGWNPENITRFESGHELLRTVESGAFFDYIFLDIQMPETNGLQIYKSLTEASDAQIIFVSTYAEHLPEVFALKAPCFLLKPYTQDTFDRTIHSVFTQQHEYVFVVVIEGERMEFSCLKIRYIQSKDHYLCIFTSKRRALFRAKLSVLEKELTPHGFFRCHRSNFINLRYYKKRDARNVYINGVDGLIKLPLSKAKSGELDDTFLRFKTQG